MASKEIPGIPLGGFTLTSLESQLHRLLQTEALLEIATKELPGRILNFDISDPFWGQSARKG
jgi:hypothetical protein